MSKTVKAEIVSTTTDLDEVLRSVSIAYDRLNKAVRLGDSETIERLVAGGVSPHGQRGKTPPIGCACLNASYRGVETLLRLGVSVRHPRPDCGNALMYAALCCKPEVREVIALLIRNECDINGLNYKGWQPIHFAMRTPSVPAVLALLEHGADLCARTTERNHRSGTSLGRSPLQILRHFHIGKMSTPDVRTVEAILAARGCVN